MNSPKGVKSGDTERVSISCPTRGTHQFFFFTNNWKPVIYVTISEKKKLNICDIGVKFVKGPYGDHRISEKNIPDSITLKPE